ncbi:methyl-accepting chemotaxis protein [Rhodanobacter sp. MP7CTX1]|uniref:methyl-accepting chemotaxis protein n=1 Tax=Rhodanobacter sp. MP7CTX1 TaxID=2723084 RepID=UPI00160764DD|nr:methyl-accepting chemotaxis protein [Rhodanobacter sp. MP7CTX1]MBB6187950.1 methyl-accepting chemotaxis protein WspA [Rhodanobacter sp. MP7CTX1]
MNITIRQRILLSFAVILAVMLVMGGVAIQRLLRIEADGAVLQGDALPGMYAADQLQSAWAANQSLLQAHMLAADAVTMTRIEDELRTNGAAFDAQLGRYEATVFTADERKDFEALKRASVPYLAALPEAIRLSRAHSDAARDFLRVRMDPTFEQANTVIVRIEEHNHSDAFAVTGDIAKAAAAAKTGIWVTFLGALALAVLTGFYLLKAISQPLHLLTRAVEVMAKGDLSGRLALARTDEFGVLAQGYDRMGNDLSALVGQVQTSGIQVNSSINEIAATLREQQATATEIAATTTEIGATSREISATSKELVRTMSTVASGAEQTAALASDGQSGLVQMGEIMGRVMEATASINAKFAVLTEKAGNISQVVTAITKVADQTNLLSLNAAIEAEKAGEYGRGFSVVATEIRRLADQTAVSTLDIEQMVREIQSAVSAGVMGMDKFSEEVRRGTSDVRRVGEQLSQVIQHVQAMVPRFESVNEGVQAQATGAEQITQALAQLSEAAQQTVDALRQSNQAVDELHHVSAGLRDGVSKFKLQA